MDLPSRFASLKPVRWTLAKLANQRIIWETMGLLIPKRGLDFFAPDMDEDTVDRFGRQMADGLRAYVNSDSVVLDLGCGLGRVAKHLAPHCKTLQAVDISAAYCLRARRYLKDLPNVTVTKVDGKSLSNFSEDTFDFVYSLGVLVHVKKDVVESYLREVNRVLRNGGMFLFNLPKPEISFPPFERYTEEELQGLLRSSPLDLKSVHRSADDLTIVMSKSDNASS